MTRRSVCLLAGGFGGSRMAHGLQIVSRREGWDLAIVVNTGDDMELHGLYVAPDLDTVMYTLAGRADRERGWGVADETWSAAAMLEAYGQPTWFRVGDRDLATHVTRTERLRGGARLTEVTASLAGALGVSARLLPMSDQPVRTEVRTADGWLDFQDWFVRRHHADDALEIRYAGVDRARPTNEAMDALAAADLIVLAPSNPFVSIGTILAVPGLLETLIASPAPCVAISPIVAGAALRGPAATMMSSLAGLDATATGVAGYYADRYPGLAQTMVIDESDRAEAQAIEVFGYGVLVAPTVMTSEVEREALARTIIEAFPVAR